MNYLLQVFQVAIVVGGGNIFRGSSVAGSSGLDRSSADYIGYVLIHDIWIELIYSHLIWESSCTQVHFVTVLKLSTTTIFQSNVP